MNECLPEEEVQEYLNRIPYPGVKAVLDNAIMSIEEWAEQGVRPTPDCQGNCQEGMIGARPARLARAEGGSSPLSGGQTPEGTT